MKFIEDIDAVNKRVILRLDLNVTIKDNCILDDTRIKKSIPTIKYLLSKGNRILIMSHLGKIKSEEDKAKNSLRIVCNHLSMLLDKDIFFVDNIKSKELDTCLDDHDLAMMENTRFADFPGSLESSCDEELSRYWASLGEVFINDAFGTTHRKHSSNYGISKYLPSAYGFLIREELVGLDPVVNNITRPFTVIMGGAKVDDKIQLIKSLLKNADYLIVGGGIANTFLKANNYNVGSSLYSIEYVEEVKEILSIYKNKIYMPVDVVVKNGLDIKVKDLDSILADDTIYDIGPLTLDIIDSIIKQSNTVLINGTVGLYEDKNFRNGTERTFQILSSSNAIKIAGGGDALTSISELGYKDSFDFLSTGGGATLDYLASGKLKCFEGEEL